MKNILKNFLFLFIFTTTVFGKQIVTSRCVYGPNGVIITYDAKTDELLNGKCQVLETTQIGITYVNIEGNFKDGLYNGVIYDYSPFGKVESVVEYKNGIKHGKSIDLEFDSNNNAYVVECNYNNGKKDGKVITYYTVFGEMDIYSANNKLEAEGYKGIITGKFKEEYYKNDILEGNTKEYYKNGQVKKEALFREGKKEGTVKEYYENGKIRGEENYKNGIPEGVAIAWYENGQVEMETIQKNGKFNGKFKFYYENGQIKMEGTAKDENLEGVTKFYYESGQIQAEKNYKNGQLEGLSKSWYENGQIKQEVNYKNGIPEGLGKSWHENGQIQMEINFKNGQMIEKKEYDINGNLK